MRKTVLLAAMIAVLALPATPSFAATGGTIEGTVTNGTTKTPVEGAEVILSQGNTQTGEGQEGIEKTRTDADGRYSFTGLTDEAPWMYDVYTEFEGAPYYSPGITITGNGTEKANLTVYDSTESAKDISVVGWIVYLDPDPSGLAVEQAIAYENSGKRSYIGTTMPNTGQRLATTLPVASSAIPDSVNTVGLFEACCGGIVGDTFGHTAPIQPGTSEGTVRYVATPPASLVFPATLPTASIEIRVAPGVEVSDISGLTPAGEQTLSGGGPSPAPVTYTIYTASNLQTGASVGLTASMGGGSGDVPVGLVVILAVVGLIALLLVIVKLRNPDTIRPSGAKKAKPKTTPKKGSGPKAGKPKKPSYSERHEPDPLDSDLLIAEIATLDLSFEQGLIGKDEYERLRAARKSELMSRSEDD